ncbi:MAG: heliorhodopsin HeR [Spirochaetales bacterium]|nr:heliorhodopsin HeR [Spirochaetales bacterium]
MARATEVIITNNVKRFSRLRIFNGIMCILHFVQGIFMITVSNDTSYPIYSYFLTFNNQTMTLVPNPEVLFRLRFGPAVGAFLLISAVAHLYLSTIGFKQYVRNLSKNTNPVRFYEYALSSSLMIVLIALLSSVWEIGTLILLAGINAIMNLFGIIMEKMNDGSTKTRWIGFVYGCFAGILPWVIIVLYFLGSINSSPVKPPSFIYGVIPSLFVFFNIFALNMFLQYKKVWKWKEYLFGETIYIVLSLAAKTLLAWQIFVGTMVPV